MHSALRPMRLAGDIATALIFFTRLPVRGPPAGSGSNLAGASWAFPLAGAVVGAIAAAVYWGARYLGVPPLPAAGVTLAATLALTGCLHEDGLADVADSLGAHTRERKLEIMRDSRIGTFGACALMLSLLLRAGALAAIADPYVAAPMLIAVHAASRGALPMFMYVVPPARPDGLSAGAGKVPIASAIAAALIGVLALAFGLGPAAGAAALVAIAAGAGLLAWLCVRQIGGQTGDVLGALEQFCEISVLLVAAACLSAGR